MSFQPATNDKLRGIDATQRGAARWERAARNALRRPHSAAARLYQERYGLALEVSRARLATAVTEQAWAFMGVKTRVTSKVPYAYVSYRGRLYSTCSTFCTVMQITLDFNTTDIDRIATVFRTDVPESRWSRTIEPLDPKTLKRDVHCYVCTAKIR